jgi:hypothetical protein
MNDERAINPYESSDAPDAAALTGHERRVLEFYLKYRYTCPTRARLISRYVPSWGIMACTFGIVLGVLYAMSGTVTAVPALVFVTGVWLGAILRDYGQCRRVIQYWPLHQRVLDWQAIEHNLIVSSPSKPLE